MRSTKVYEILTHFDRIEHNRLRKYLCSPYFNPNASLVDLYEILRKDIFSSSRRELSKEKVWAKLKLDRGYDDVYFRKMCSDLLKLVEGFLAQQIYEGNPLAKSNDLIEAVTRRKVSPLYSSSVRTARSLSQKHPHRSATWFYQQYLLERNLYDLRNVISYSRLEKSNIEEILSNLDEFYLAEKLKFYCIILGQRSFSTHDYDLNLMAELLEFVRENLERCSPVVQIYFQIYLTQTDLEEESHYFRLRSLITQHISLFPQEERYFIYNFALNYGIRLINRGKGEFLEEYYEVYKEALEVRALFIEDQLSPWHFRNIIGVALRLGHYDWADHFIAEYSEFLPPENRENAVTFNRATLYFYQKRFREVIELLREVEYEELTYNLNSKNMLLLTYYELDEIDPLYSLMESFRTYLNRHKDIARKRRQSYLALIKFTKKLSRLIPGDEKEVEKIRQEMDGHPTEIASEKWLREKLEELA